MELVVPAFYFQDRNEALNLKTKGVIICCLFRAVTQLWGSDR
jgi:hypothetical protein